jgi:hypothetical protein
VSVPLHPKRRNDSFNRLTRLRSFPAESTGRKRFEARRPQKNQRHATNLGKAEGLSLKPIGDDRDADGPESGPY